VVDSSQNIISGKQLTRKQYINTKDLNIYKANKKHTENTTPKSYIRERNLNRFLRVLLTYLLMLIKEKNSLLII
jgi:hypothetical protein